jgi:hypothetical protein
MKEDNKNILFFIFILILISLRNINVLYYRRFINQFLQIEGYNTIVLIHCM